MTFKVDAQGRRRYIGSGKRGRPSPLRTAAIDLGQAIEALARARQVLEVAAEAGDRRGRAAAMDEARAHAELGIRFARDVTRRVLGGGRPRRRPGRRHAIVTVQMRFTW